MLMKLDKSKPFAKISPAYWGKRDEFDRPAYYAQGKPPQYFDKDGFAIIAGQPREAAPPAALEKADIAPNGSVRPPSDYQAITSPLQLFQREKELPLRHLQERARTIFGSLNKPYPIENRAQILEGLLEVLGARGLVPVQKE
jgi:hypothetical protein